MADQDAKADKKVHRERKSGRKADKKQSKNKHVQEQTDKQRNPKAFTFNSAVRAERNFRRTKDIQTKKYHIPLVDRTPIEPPPILVAIVGPARVGKSTLMQCLIKHYCKQKIANIHGPVTLVIGKKMRLTLIECNNDINSMIDIAKVADLVLLLVDAFYGFEMEVFEFLNICQVHGMPRIMAVLTHLDLIKNVEKLKKVKKTLKHRLWTETYQGAKLFYLSGILHGEYLKNDVKKLARFIMATHFRPIAWRTTHPYILADRFEDLTQNELIRQNPKVNRTVSFYGFVRGIPMNKTNGIHIPGCGDMKIEEMMSLPDPCPLPDKIKKRSLHGQERLIYAPFSGVGGIVYDKDAVYIELGNRGSHHHMNPDSELLFNNILKSQETLEKKIEQSEIQLFSNSDNKEIVPVREKRKVTEEMLEDKDIQDELERELNSIIGLDGNTDNSTHKYEEKEESDSDDDDEWEDADSEDDLNEKENPDNIEEDEEEDVLSQDNVSVDMNEETTDDEEEEESTDDEDKEDMAVGLYEDQDMEVEFNQAIDSSVKWKENLAQKASDAFLERQCTNHNLWKLSYNEDTHNDREKTSNSEKSDNDNIGELFHFANKRQKDKLQKEDDQNQIEASDILNYYTPSRTDDSVNLISDYFVTGKWKESEDARSLLLQNDINDDDDDIYGDFEDMETGKKHVAKESENQASEENDDLASEEKKAPLTKKELLEKKQKQKESFDAEYDEKTHYDELKEEMSMQAQLNKNEFQGMDENIRQQHEGFRPGLYVRLQVSDVPCELVENFDPDYPLIVGGLISAEENIGYVQIRMKKHRWYPKILKSRDPLIISLGWRRFQTLPLYAKLEDNLKHRFLKYTPPHLSCIAHMWGPITTQGTGMLAIQNLSSQQQGFRIAATGMVTELDHSAQIMKKLKLTGVPLKIYNKTAFVKGMFNSSLEVAKFEGAKIKTVSGIRGQIKKGVNKPEGAFRATFEDKIKLSDIVFCRTWYKVDIPQLYNPITSLLLPKEKKNQWTGMKTLGELKREQNIKIEPNTDNLYTDIERQPQVFKPLVIPRTLQRELPYKDKPKKKINKKYDEKNKRIAVIKEPKEQKVSKMMRMLKTAYIDKRQKMRIDMNKRMTAHQNELEKEEFKKLKRQKELRKQVFRTLSKMEKKDSKKQR